MEKITQICLSVLMVILSLPIPLKYSSMALILCVFSLSILIVKNGVNKIKLKESFILLCLAFFSIDIIRNIISLDFNTPIIHDAKLVFALIPIVFFNAFFFLKKNLNLIVLSFIIGVGCYLCYCWMFACYFYFIKYPEYYSFSLSDGYLRYMLYNYLPGAIHHTYIGMYIAFAIQILFVYTFVKNKMRKIVGGVLIIFFLFSLLYIGSKVTIVMALLFLVLGVLSKVNINVKSVFLTFTVASLLIATFLFVNNKDWILAGIVNSLDSRLEVYSCAIDAIKNNYLLGLGQNNSDLIINQYCPNFKLFDKFIPHNIFIKEVLANGFLGGLILLLLLLYLLKKSFQGKSILLLSLIFMLITVGMIEDIIYRQRGVFFFVLMISVFYSYQERNQPV